MSENEPTEEVSVQVVTEDLPDVNGHVEETVAEANDDVDSRRESVSKEPPPTVAPKPKRPSCMFVFITICKLFDCVQV